MELKENEVDRPKYSNTDKEHRENFISMTWLASSLTLYFRWYNVGTFGSYSILCHKVPSATSRLALLLNCEKTSSATLLSSIQPRNRLKWGFTWWPTNGPVHNE